MVIRERPSNYAHSLLCFVESYYLSACYRMTSLVPELSYDFPVPVRQPLKIPIWISLAKSYEKENTKQQGSIWVYAQPKRDEVTL